MENDYPDKLLDAIIAILIEERKKQGLSQEKLANRAGLTRPTVSFMESGRNKPSLHVCIKLSGALGFSFETLVKMAENRAPLI